MKKFIFLKQEIYEILNKEVAGDVDIINIFDSVCAFDYRMTSEKIMIERSINCMLR